MLLSTYVYAVSYHYQFPTERYTFELKGVIDDGQHFWHPHDRYDFIVPLHHFSVDVGWHEAELKQKVEMALWELGPLYSSRHGEPLQVKSEVLTTKGRLYISTLHRPYIVPNESRPEEGDSIGYREVKVTGHLEYDDGVLFARCDQIEFFPLPEMIKPGPDQVVLDGARDF